MTKYKITVGESTVEFATMEAAILWALTNSVDTSLITSFFYTQPAAPLAEQIAATLLVYSKFGKECIALFAAENCLLGITDAQSADFMQNHLALVMSINFGYLPTAIYMIKHIPVEQKDPVFLSDARLLAIVNKIEDYLGAPLSGSL